MKTFIKQSLVAVALSLTVIVSNVSFADTVTLPQIQAEFGQTVDIDGMFGGQCYDLANDYLIKQGSNGIGGGTGRAGFIGTEFQAQLESEGFVVMNNVTNNQIQAGDLICIAPSTNGTDDYFGHVAIVESVNADGSFTTLEQNAEQGQIVARYTRFYAEYSITSIVRK